VAIAVFLHILVPVILIVLGAFDFISRMTGIGTFFPMAMGTGLLALGSFGKAFAVSEILQIIGKIGWGKYIIWLIVTSVISLAVGALSSIPLIGWILSLIVSPVLGVFAMRSAALIYNEAVPTTEAPPAPPPVGVTSTVKFCAHCGARMPADATFCPNCGARQ